MAASDLTDSNDIQPHVEVNVTTLSQPTSPRVTNGKPAHLTSAPTPPTNERDGKKRAAGGKMSRLLKQNQLIQSLNLGLRKQCDYIKITVPEERSNRLPKEWWKTGVAFLYAVFNLVFTTVVITIVHERVPDKSVNPPLPDKFFDYVDRVPWAFTVTEVNGLILCGLWLIQWLLLNHKYVCSISRKSPETGRSDWSVYGCPDHRAEVCFKFQFSRSLGGQSCTEV